jgi:hypothetical protein
MGEREERKQAAAQRRKELLADLAVRFEEAVKSQLSNGVAGRDALLFGAEVLDSWYDYTVRQRPQAKAEYLSVLTEFTETVGRNLKEVMEEKKV